jgi:hypothetical protein
VGLDNGIIIKRTPETKKIKELRRFEYWDVHYEEEDVNYSYDICYWRKCWNVRDMIFENIHKYKCAPIKTDCRWALNIEAIDGVIEGLKAFNKDNWDDDRGSIWSFQEMKKKLRQNVRDLKSIKKLMKKYNLVVEFYDSY